MAKPTGRPSKLTPEVQRKVVEALRGGNYREVAAKWAGVGVRTFSTWMDRGEAEPEGPYGAFRQAVLEAEQAAEIRAVALIMQAAANDPKHAQWWLERKFPERWGRKDRRDPAEASAGGPVQVVVKVAGDAPSGGDGA